MVFQSEHSCVLAYDLDVLPAQASEPPSCNFAERGREVNEVDTVEELRHIDILGHGLYVPAGSTTNLEISSILVVSLV